MSSAQRFFALEIAFLAGIALNGVLHGMTFTLFIVGMLLCAVAFAAYRPRSLVPLLGLAVMFGAGRALLLPSTPPIVQQADRAVRFTGVVVEEVDRRLEKQKLVVDARAILEKTGSRQVRGRVLVNTELYPEYAYGDAVEVQCTLERPGTIEGFAYDRYLALSSIFAVCWRGRVSVLAHDRGNVIVALLLSAKEALLRTINDRFSEPQASLLAGLLVGARRGIPNGVLTAFQRTGLTHIIALSGFNITILAAATFAFAIRIGLHRKHAFWVVLLVLVAFLVITGAPSSVLRACVMGMTMLLARRLGRPGNIWYALIFAASCMVAVNPAILVDDVGFQLSFLATLGLVVLSKRIEPMIRFLPSTFGIREAAGAALAATAFTLPLTMTKFGFVSFVAPVANILVVPLIPVTMLAGFLSILPIVGMVAAPVASILLTWIVWVPEMLSRFRFAGAAVNHVPVWIAPVCYGVVALLVFRRRFFLLLRQWPHHSKRDVASLPRASSRSS